MGTKTWQILAPYCNRYTLKFQPNQNLSGTSSYLAFLAFAGIVTGLAVCLGVAAWGRTAGRLWLGGLAAIHTGELLFLIYVWFVPYPTQGYGPWTSVAALECGLCISIAVGTTALGLALNRATSRH